jgi:hypothetical protein
MGRVINLKKGGEAVREKKRGKARIRVWKKMLSDRCSGMNERGMNCLAPSLLARRPSAQFEAQNARAKASATIFSPVDPDLIHFTQG